VKAPRAVLPGGILFRAKITSLPSQPRLDEQSPNLCLSCRQTGSAVPGTPCNTQSVYLFVDLLTIRLWTKGRKFLKRFGRQRPRRGWPFFWHR
jgi:hypothetical protein